MELGLLKEMEGVVPADFERSDGGQGSYSLHFFILGTSRNSQDSLVSRLILRLQTLPKKLRRG